MRVGPAASAAARSTAASVDPRSGLSVASDIDDGRSMFGQELSGRPAARLSSSVDKFVAGDLAEHLAQDVALGADEDSGRQVTDTETGRQRDARDRRAPPPRDTPPSLCAPWSGHRRAMGRRCRSRAHGSSAALGSATDAKVPSSAWQATQVDWNQLTTAGPPPSGRGADRRPTRRGVQVEAGGLGRAWRRERGWSTCASGPAGRPRRRSRRTRPRPGPTRGRPATMTFLR